MNPITLEFDLRLGVVASSYVDIEQRSATTQVLEIAGLIDNPIGLTRLVNLNGPITATGAARIITNQLDAYAPSTTIGSIGSAAARLAVDLVRYRAFPTLSDPVGGFFDPRIVVDAGVDAYLSLRGVDRTNTFTGAIDDGRQLADAGRRHRDLGRRRLHRRRPGHRVRPGRRHRGSTG